MDRTEEKGRAWGKNTRNWFYNDLRKAGEANTTGRVRVSKQNACGNDPSSVLVTFLDPNALPGQDNEDLILRLEVNWRRNPPITIFYGGYPNPDDGIEHCSRDNQKIREKLYDLVGFVRNFC